jgi:hypothetical protein
MKPGYAYSYTGDAGAWKTSPDDDWDTEMQSNDGGTYLGSRRIDGSECTVWEVDGAVYAQTAVMAPAPRGGASSREPGLLDAASIMRNRGRASPAAERYARSSPRGWGGDPSRGAALGRATEAGSADYDGKLALIRIKINRGGYDPQGTYFGVGEPLFNLSDEDGTIDRTFRARDRKAAVAMARGMYPRAKVR